MTLIRPLALCEMNLGSKPMPVLRTGANGTHTAISFRELPSVLPSLGFSRLSQMCARHLGLVARWWQQQLLLPSSDFPQQPLGEAHHVTSHWLSRSHILT